MKPPPETPIRFILDDASGGLMKWLRMLGFDTIYRREYEKTVAEKMNKGDIHLTMSQSLGNKEMERIIHLKHRPVAAQLHYVMTACGITRENVKPFSRCIICNKVTQRIDKSMIRGRIPDYVWETHEIFRECPACRRIYWRGTHAEKINKTIKNIFQRTE